MNNTNAKCSTNPLVSESRFSSVRVTPWYDSSGVFPIFAVLTEKFVSVIPFDVRESTTTHVLCWGLLLRHFQQTFDTIVVWVSRYRFFSFLISCTRLLISTLLFIRERWRQHNSGRFTSRLDCCGRKCFDSTLQFLRCYIVHRLDGLRSWNMDWSWTRYAHR